MSDLKQLIFGALAKKGLRAQGATAFVKRDKEKKPDAEKKHCGCWTIVHEKVPHPKYGDRVPHFEDKQVKDPNCPHARAEAERLLSKVSVPAPAAPVPFEMEPEETPEYDGRCQAITTTLGRRCKNGTPGRYCRVHDK